MRSRPARRLPAAGLLAAAALFVVGCAEIRLPAIDPSGQRIFLPPPNSTTIDWPHEGGLFGGWPEPAFQSPPDPPLCPPPADPSTSTPPPIQPTIPSGPTGPCVAPGVTPSAAGPFGPAGAPQVLHPGFGTPRSGLLRRHLHPPDPDSAVTLTPIRLVAMVGTEVVLVGGVCGGDGFYRVHEPVEWLLTQDSTGTFVEVGEPEHPLLGGWPGGHAAEKLSHNWAVGRTLGHARVLTRGTPDPKDDIQLEAGQTWITLTSSAEGTSNVVLVAPEVPNWRGRIQSAAIHWVDAAWTLPGPVFGTGQVSPELVTTVVRASTGEPAADWIVRYEIVGGTPAGLNDPTAQSAEVHTDSTGRAIVQVVPQGPPTGSTQVRIQLIRPRVSAGDPARLVVAEGLTSVTWTSASLAVRIAGPDRVEVGQEARYDVEVSNIGNVAAANVVLVGALPFGMEWIGSNPPGQFFQPRLQWSLGTLAAGQSTRVDIAFRALEAGVAQVCVRAEAGAIASSQQCVATEITQQPLRISINGPQEAEVGQRVRYLISIVNQTNQPLENLLVRDVFDPGLEHSQATGSVERDIVRLEPGAVEQFPIAFTVRQPGQLCHRVEVSHPTQGLLGSAQACLVAVPSSRREVQVQITGPSQARVGEQAAYRVQVANTGDVPLTDLQIVDTYERPLRPSSASEGYQQFDSQIGWRLPRLEPGQSVWLEIGFQAVFQAERACHEVQVETAEGVVGRNQACLEILGTAPQVEPPAGPTAPPDAAGPTAPLEPPPSAPSTNGAPTAPSVNPFDIAWTVLGSPAQVGDTLQLNLVLQNRQGAADEDLRIVFELPAGLELVRVTGPVGAATQDNGTLRMVPIRQVRANEPPLGFLVFVRATQPGAQTARVTITSRRAVQPLVRELTVEVLDR